MQVITVATHSVSLIKKWQSLFAASNFNGQILSYLQRNTIYSLVRKAIMFPKVRTSIPRISISKLNLLKVTCRFKTSLCEEPRLETLIQNCSNQLEIGICKLLVFKTVTWVGSKFSTHATSKPKSHKINSNISTLSTISQSPQIICLWLKWICSSCKS
jgi:hypothetical protein